VKMLIKGALVISGNGRVPRSGDILVVDGCIEAVEDSIIADGVDDVVEASNMIACPGFTNAHVHSWQAGLRGLAGDWAVPQYMQAMHRGLARHFRPEDVYIATLASSLNQINNGCTNVFDWCHNNPTPEHTDAAVDALVSSGMRALFLHGSPKPGTTAGGKHHSEIPMPPEEMKRLVTESRHGDLLRVGMAALGPQYGTFDVCVADMELARELDLVVSLHTGGGPMLVPDGFERLLAMGLIDERVNIVHGNNIADRTLGALIDAGANFTVTPEVELQMGFGDLVTGKVLELGGLVTLGTDVEAAVCSDMFSGLRTALQLQRHQDNVSLMSRGLPVTPKTSVSCKTALDWITTNPAKAMRSHSFGSLERGKAADLILLRATDLNMFPVHDAHTAVVMQAGAANVDSVMVRGVWLKRAGKLTCSVDIPSLQSQLAESAARIAKLTGIQSHLQSEDAAVAA